MATDYMGNYVPDDEYTPPTTQDVEPIEPIDVDTDETEDQETDAADDDADIDGSESRKLTPTEKRLAAAKALLAELEAKATEERREKARKAAEAETARDKRLAASRGAALKQLYAAKGIEPIPGDRTEKERFAALLGALKVKV